MSGRARLSAWEVSQSHEGLYEEPGAPSHEAATRGHRVAEARAVYADLSRQMAVQHASTRPQRANSRPRPSSSSSRAAQSTAAAPATFISAAFRGSAAAAAAKREAEQQKKTKAGARKATSAKKADTRTSGGANTVGTTAANTNYNDNDEEEEEDEDVAGKLAALVGMPPDQFVAQMSADPERFQRWLLERAAQAARDSAHADQGQRAHFAVGN